MYYLHRIPIAFFSLLLVCNTSWAQTPQPKKHYTYSVGGSVSKGFIIGHDLEMKHLALSHPEGVSLWIKKHTYGHRDWEKTLKYPDIGLVIDYFDYRNPLLGYSIAATSFLDYYLARANKSSLNFQFGIGLCYSSSPYHKTDNNKNIAIGSPITYSLRAQLSYNRQLIDRVKLMMALRLTHYSNGAYKLPNKGINVPTADLGFSYTLNKDKPAYKYFSTLPTVDNDIKFNIFIGTGLKQVIINGEKYPFITASLYTSKQASLLNSFNLGMDYFHSWAIREEVAIDPLLEGEEPDFRRIGLVGGHELLIGRLSFLTQLGVYIYRPYKRDKPIYQRYGLKYALSDNIFGGVFLKSHYGRAEAVEWGIGMKF